MTSSIEYEKQAQIQIDHIDTVGTKAVELAKIYARLATSAAIREQAEAIRKNGPRSSVTGDLL